MTAPLSNDLRDRVVGAIGAGESCRSAAARFGVAVSSAVKWHQRYRATGSVAPGKMGGHRKRMLEPHRAFMGSGRPDHLPDGGRLVRAEIIHVCLNASRWDCTLEPTDDEERFAVRLGFRMVKGLANQHAASIVGARGDQPFAPLPLFAAATAREEEIVPEIAEPAVSLRPITAGGEVVEDYATLGCRSDRIRPHSSARICAAGATSR